MELRRILFQLAVFSGCVAFALTLWRSMELLHLDLLQAALRAVGAGAAILVFALLVSGFIERLGGASAE